MISASLSGRTAGASAATRSGGTLTAPGRWASSYIIGDCDSTRKKCSLRSIFVLSSSRVTLKFTDGLLSPRSVHWLSSRTGRGGRGPGGCTGPDALGGSGSVAVAGAGEAELAVARHGIA